jgi:hypothetical protein
MFRQVIQPSSGWYLWYKNTIVIKCIRVILQYNIGLNLLLVSNIKQNVDDYKIERVKINFNQKLDGHVSYSSSPLFFFTNIKNITPWWQK